MILNKETIYSKDLANKKLKVVREFDAPVDKVWKAWTETAMLDKWWAPKPWKAVTQSMDFRKGGAWLYYMQGPEGERHYCRVDYKAITPGKMFAGYDAFCDENGKPTNELPQMYWEVDFVPAEGNTEVDITITFNSEEDMDKIMEMGFREGFAAAHNNLDELLAG